MWTNCTEWTRLEVPVGRFRAWQFVSDGEVRVECEECGWAWSFTAWERHYQGARGFWRRLLAHQETVHKVYAVEGADGVPPEGGEC